LITSGLQPIDNEPVTVKTYYSKLVGVYNSWGYPNREVGKGSLCVVVYRVNITKKVQKPKN